MTRPKGSKNKKPYPVTEKLLAHNRANARKLHENAHGAGVQVRIEQATADRLRAAIPRREERRNFVIKAINDALDALEAK